MKLKQVLISFLIVLLSQLSYAQVTHSGMNSNTVLTNKDFVPHSNWVPAPKVDDANQTDCEKSLKASYPKETKVAIANACNKVEVQDAVLGKNFFRGVRKDAYFSCVQKLKDLKITNDDIYTDCARDYKNTDLSSAQFATCYPKAEVEFGALEAYDNCQKPTFAHDYATDEFNQCRKKLQDLSQDSKTVLSKCKSFVDRSLLISKGFARCQNTLQSAKVNTDSIIQFCSFDKILSNMDKPDYSSCEKAVGKMTANPFTTISLCSNSDVLKILPQTGALACIESSLKSTYKNYIPYVALGTQYLNEKNYFNFLARDCKSQTQNQPTQNPYLKLVKDINIHTREVMALDDSTNASAQVGGISALSYDQQSQTLYALSDETRMSTQLPPRMYKYKLNDQLDLVDQKVMTFTFGSQAEPDIDPEGMVRLKSGQFILSSEVGKNQTEVTEDKVVNITNINSFDERGVFQNSIPLPTSYKSKYVKTEVNNGPKNNKKSSKNNQIDSDMYTQASYTYYRHTGGLEFNKSLESLTITPDESILLTANESSLLQDAKLKGKCQPEEKTDAPENNEVSNDAGNVQDKDSKSSNSNLPVGATYYKKPQLCGKVIRIARLFKNPKPQDKNKVSYLPGDEFKYELEPEIDNGIVEILALNNQSLLTLERSWDNVKQKVTSRIFKIHLTGTALIPANATDKQIDEIEGLKKHLILDLDSIIGNLSPGFRILDNFEGMAFGPTLANGNRTLLIVSDNNYSARQRTTLLVFEVAPALLD